MVTLAEYDQILNPPEGFWELYHGELVKAPFRTGSEMKAVYRLRRLLGPAEGDAWVADERMPFCPVPEYECWAADVGFVSKRRWENISDWLGGAPELVVGIISPLNTLPKLLDKARICLGNGCREFWVVNLRGRRIRVLAPQADVIYECGQRIPLLFGGEISVSEIFE